MFGYSFSFIIQELILEWLYKYVVCGLCPLHYKAAKQYAALIGIPETEYQLNADLRRIKMAAIYTAMAVQATNKFEQDKNIHYAYRVMNANNFASMGEIIAIAIATGNCNVAVAKIEEYYSTIVGAYRQQLALIKVGWRKEV